MLPKISALRVRSQVVLESADAARDAKSWNLAESLYKSFLNRHPGRAAIWVQYGHALKEQGKLTEAENAYRKSLSIEPLAADTHLQLGHVLKLQDRWEECAEAYLKSYQADPSSIHSVEELAGLWPGAGSPSWHRGWGDFAADHRFQSEIAPLLDDGGKGAAGPIWAECKARERGYLNANHLLEFNGLSASLLNNFDHLYYFYSNEVVRQDLFTHSFYACLVHFCEKGLHALLPIGEDLDFEVHFYTQTYDPVAKYSGALAYRHWLNTGIGLGWHPNKRAWVRSLVNLDIADYKPSDLDQRIGVRIFGEQKEKWSDRFKHFIDTDILFESRDDYLSDGGALTIAAARRFVEMGNDEAALRLYERVLSQRSSDIVMLAWADILQRRGSHINSSRSTNQLIANNNALVGTYNQAQYCLSILGDLKTAFAVARKCVEIYPGNTSAVTRFKAAGDACMTDAWNRALRIARAGNVLVAQEVVRSTCQFLVSMTAFNSALPQRPIRSIAIVYVEISAQCMLYRVDQKFEHIVQAGYHVKLFHERDMDRYLEQVESFDAVIFYRNPAWMNFIYAVERSRQFGLHIFYDLDDLLFGGDFPDTFESYSGFIDMDDYIGLQIGVPLFEEAVKLCDYGIASTTPLAAEMAKRVRSGRTFVHRNAFSNKHAPFASRDLSDVKDGPVTIFYGSGTKAHGEDFQILVEPALIKVARKYKHKINIKLAGYVQPSVAMDEVSQYVSTLPLDWNVEAYWSNLKTADINIAVLKRGPMTDAKSEIKWMEAAMFGIPSVVSTTANYEEVIDPGVTGLLCDTPDQWTDALMSLVENKGLRKEMGRKAWETVTLNYGINRMAQNIVGIFSQFDSCLANTARRTILVVNVFYMPRPIGGATRVVYDNLTYMRNVYGQEFNFEVFTTEFDDSDNYSISTYVNEGVRVTVIRRPLTVEIEDSVVDARVGELFGDFLDKLKPALVHFHCIQRLTVSVVSAAKQRSIPYIITVHDAWWISQYQFTVDKHGRQHFFDFNDGTSVWDDGGRLAYDKFIAVRPPLFGAKHVIAVSSKFADLYRSCGVPNVMACPNGISALPPTTRTISTDGRVRLGFIGGMHRSKGYHLLKLAFINNTFSRLSLTIIDHGLQPGETKSASWSGTPVIFRAKVPEKEVGSLYAEIDVLLAPSIWPESFGLVTREAVHHGCWVVASKLGSIGDPVVEGKNGHLIDVQDADDLIRVLSDIDLNADTYLSPPSIEPAKGRGSDEQAEELVAIYRSCLSA